MRRRLLSDASSFSKVYEMMPDFWKTRCNRIEDYVVGKKIGKERCAFSANIASCRIAEKLGGVAVKGKNPIVEAMHEAGIHSRAASLNGCGGHGSLWRKE